MTIREIIERVESTLVNGLPVQIRGGYISHRWIYSVLKSMRSRILVQKANKRQNISSWNRQVLHCVPLEVVPEEECLCYSSNNCVIKRTTIRIPDILTGLSDYLIESVSSNGNKIDIISKNSAKYQTYSRFTGNKPSAFIDDGYVWIKNGSYIDHITITAVFDDPVDVIEYNNTYSCSDVVQTCCQDITNNEFPIDNDLADTCIMMTIQEISMAFLKQQGNDRNEEKEEEA